MQCECIFASGFSALSAPVRAFCTAPPARGRMQRQISLLLASAMALSLLPVSAFADYTGVGGISPDTVTAQELDAENPAEITKTFEVADGTAFVAALDEINADDSGSGNYVIKLTGDINISGDHSFEKNTTTILGEGHSISGGNNQTLGVQGTATLNLGADDYTGELVLKGVSDYVPTGPLLQIGGNASATMYKGDTFQDHKVLGSDAGVQLNNHASFTMYGVWRHHHRQQRSHRRRLRTDGCIFHGSVRRRKYRVQ